MRPGSDRESLRDYLREQINAHRRTRGGLWLALDEYHLAATRETFDVGAADGFHKAIACESAVLAALCEVLGYVEGVSGGREGGGQ